MPEEENLKQESPEELRNKSGAKTEEFIIDNANINGINPNPTESGNSPEWDKAIKESEKYKSDAKDEE